VQAVVRSGRDPIAERQAAKAARAAEDAEAKAKAITFAEAADMYIRAHQAAWRDPRHAQQWRSSLDRYVMPTLGDMAVSVIDTSNVMRILEPLWREKTETASRVRGRTERILDFTRVHGWRAGETPWRAPAARRCGSFWFTPRTASAMSREHGGVSWLLFWTSPGSPPKSYTSIPKAGDPCSTSCA
jgi:hypothetical protein